MITPEKISNSKEISQIMSKILNISQDKVNQSIDLFDNIDPDIKNCLYTLNKIDKKDYITAFMLLNYLLIKGDGALDLVGDS